jgi:hypothetical protein
MSRRVLVLAVLVLVVGGVLVFRELPILESERDRALAELLVFGEAPSVVDTVRIRQDQREILIVREPDSWYLRAPIDEAVPELPVLDLIERLKLTERWRGIATGLSEEEWEAYGLGADSPGRSRIELIGEDGRVAVDVGLLTPGSRLVWVRRVGSDDLETCFEDLHDVANMTHQGLRDPRLFKVNHKDLTRMTFDADDNRWSAVRGEDGLWFLSGEDGPRLKRWILEDVAFSVAGLRCDGYLRDFLGASDWAAYGLDQPWGTVEWEATEGRSGTLWLGNEVNGAVVFGRRDGLDSVFQIAPGLDRAFGADPGEWIDRNPIGGNFLQAAKIRVDVDGGGYLDVIRETPGARVETEDGPLEGGDYVQVTARNLQLGIEEFQPLAEMFVPSGQDPVALLDPVEATLQVHWPDRVVDLAIGEMAGGVWIAYDGMLYQTSTDMLLRVREVLKLRSAP